MLYPFYKKHEYISKNCRKRDIIRAPKTKKDRQQLPVDVLSLSCPEDVGKLPNLVKSCIFTFFLLFPCSCHWVVLHYCICDWRVSHWLLICAQQFPCKDKAWNTNEFNGWIKKNSSDGFHMERGKNVWWDVLQVPTTNMKGSGWKNGEDLEFDQRWRLIRAWMQWFLMQWWMWIEEIPIFRAGFVKIREESVVITENRYRLE